MMDYITVDTYWKREIYEQTPIYTNMCTREQLMKLGILQYSEKGIERERREIAKWKEEKKKKRKIKKNRGLSIVKEKLCRKCGRVLPMTAFYGNINRPDGHSQYRRECLRAYYHSHKIKQITNK